MRTAWHGPGDTSPVGHAANLMLDLNTWNFGIQEYAIFGERTKEVFPGCPEVRDGYMWSNGKPGLGIDINEDLAAQYPFKERAFGGAWDTVRRADIRPRLENAAGVRVKDVLLHISDPASNNAWPVVGRWLFVRAPIAVSRVARSRRLNSNVMESPLHDW